MMTIMIVLLFLLNGSHDDDDGPDFGRHTIIIFLHSALLTTRSSNH